MQSPAEQDSIINTADFYKADPTETSQSTLAVCCRWKIRYAAPAKLHAGLAQHMTVPKQDSPRISGPWQLNRDLLHLHTSMRLMDSTC